MRLLAILSNLGFLTVMLLLCIAEMPRGNSDLIVTGMVFLPSVISLIYILWGTPKAVPPTDL